LTAEKGRSKAQTKSFTYLTSGNIYAVSFKQGTKTMKAKLHFFASPSTFPNQPSWPLTPIAAAEFRSWPALTQPPQQPVSNPP